MTDLYDWQQFCSKAEIESDLAKVHRRVLDAEKAIFTRQIEIMALPHDDKIEAELKALNSATSDLLVLKTERLGWPVEPEPRFEPAIATHQRRPLNFRN